MYTPQRVNVSAKAQPILEEIMETTGLGAGEVVTLLITRYGSHFLNWHNSSPHTNLTPAPMSSPPPTASPRELDEENIPAIEL